MVDVQKRDDVFRRVEKKDVRWLRKHFFALIGKEAAVNKLIEKPRAIVKDFDRKLYKHKGFVTRLCGEWRC